jgi:hypothetical protein
MDLLYRLNAGWRDFMDNKSDQRTSQWPLMSSPLPTIGICLAYVYIVKVNLQIIFIFALIIVTFSAIKRLLEASRIENFNLI